APLESKLTSGDTVEIFTSKAPMAGPKRDWLKIVETPRARNKIRQWFSRERREDAIEQGRDELAKEMRKESMPVQKLASSAPVLGDEIIGFVTRGRGVSVHRSDCANAAALSSDEVGRMIEVEWDRDQAGVFVASIEVKALDRSRLLADVSRVLSDYHVSILRS